MRALVLIGEAAPAIKKALCGLTEIIEAKDMAGAVSAARNIAKSGWIVLLSPMCSSFDMFKDYKERGDVFKKAVFTMKSISGEVKV